MAPKLPKHVALYAKSIEKYVKYQSDGSGTGYTQTLAANSDLISSSLSKFEIIPSATNQSMVHIRSCYNYKFVRMDPRGTMVTAAMDGPDESLTSRNSTMFQPELLTDGTIRLLHVQTKHYAQWLDSNNVYRSWIHTLSVEPLLTKSENIFQAIDWESLLALPRHLAFKGDNGLYLGLDEEHSGPALRFEIGYERERTVANEIIALRDGTFRIKNDWLGSFWRVDGQTGFLQADEGSNTPTPESVFVAVKVNDYTIALRNVDRDNKYCAIHTSKHATNGLNAVEYEMTKQTHLVLTDLVISRTIVDIKFNLNDGFIYNKLTNQSLIPGQMVSNKTSKVQTLTVNIPYTDVKSSTWRVVIPSLKLKPHVQIKPVQIPQVSDSSAIQMVTPFQASYPWGETTTVRTRAYKSHTVVLQPMTKVTLRLFATSVSCEVPFEYTKYDVLNESSGQEDIDIMEDGMYTGTNYINVTVHASAPLPVT